MLAKLASGLLGLVPIETLPASNIEGINVVLEVWERETWMVLIKEYLTKGTIPKRKK